MNRNFSLKKSTLLRYWITFCRLTFLFSVHSICHLMLIKWKINYQTKIVMECKRSGILLVQFNAKPNCLLIWSESFDSYCTHNANSWSKFNQKSYFNLTQSFHAFHKWLHMLMLYERFYTVGWIYTIIWWNET